MDQRLWEKSIVFHGHECPGLAIGFRACEIAKEKLGLDFSDDEELICISEIDSCPVDAIRFVAGCTEEKGNLIINRTGNAAFSFFNDDTGESVRLVLKKMTGEMTKDESKRFILEAPAEEVFSILDSF